MSSRQKISKADENSNQEDLYATTEPSFGSTSSIPSIETASLDGQEAGAKDDPDPVSADQERQILLLMLLAQVCALHDPTPKAFVIHVIELFERGLLDRESIHFLFELGLVPSLSPSKKVTDSRCT